MVSKLGYQDSDISITFMNTQKVRSSILMLVIMDLTSLRVLHIRPRRLKLGPFSNQKV